MSFDLNAFSLDFVLHCDPFADNFHGGASAGLSGLPLLDDPNMSFIDSLGLDGKLDLVDMYSLEVDGLFDPLPQVPQTTQGNFHNLPAGAEHFAPFLQTQPQPQPQPQPPTSPLSYSSSTPSSPVSRVPCSPTVKAPHGRSSTSVFDLGELLVPRIGAGESPKTKGRARPAKVSAKPSKESDDEWCASSTTSQERKERATTYTVQARLASCPREVFELSCKELNAWFKASGFSKAEISHFKAERRREQNRCSAKTFRDNHTDPSPSAL